ncbi:MAG: hypothetical protein QOC92_3890 [Acidimicrobiaceae bacterium]
MTDRLKVVVSGMVAGDPHHGGATWAVLQYVLGLRALGHDVMLVEPVDALSSATVTYARTAMAAAGVEHWALLEESTHDTAGAAYRALLQFATEADLLLNVSGMLTDQSLLEGISVRAYLDLDPAFVQLWQAVEGIDMRFDAHTHFVTVGTNIGKPDCHVPTCDRTWLTTLPPVVLSEWRPADDIVHDAFTTVGNWRGYGSIQHDGVFYGQRAHSLREYIELPTRSGERFALALAVHPDETADLHALQVNGWELLDPRVLAGTPDDYRSFVQGSKAELGIAKSGYVVSRSGWFSDRSACYLASGRPVAAQDTGFGDALPTGVGLLSFATIDSALAVVDEISCDYPRHQKAAREIAEGYLDSSKVLERLLGHLTST